MEFAIIRSAFGVEACITRKRPSVVIIHCSRDKTRADDVTHWVSNSFMRQLGSSKRLVKYEIIRGTSAIACSQLAATWTFRWKFIDSLITNSRAAYVSCRRVRDSIWSKVKLTVNFYCTFNSQAATPSSCKSPDRNLFLEVLLCSSFSKYRRNLHFVQLRREPRRGRIF